jgi:hypothetical protein
MPAVDLEENEWGALMNILATTKDWPWTATNPLLMKIGEQLRKQASKIYPNAPHVTAQNGDSKEVHGG